MLSHNTILSGLQLYLGIDIGTSGVRACVIDEGHSIIASARESMPKPIQVDSRPCQDPEIWWHATKQCLSQLNDGLRVMDRTMAEIAAIAVDGTSGTMLLTDAKLNPLTRGYMYNSSGFDQQASEIERHATPGSMARGNGSGLARMLFLQSQASSADAAHLMHQADWIAGKILGRGGCSDETNTLKTGYDLQQRKWPEWFEECSVWTNCLPSVEPVGQPYGCVGAKASAEFGFSSDAKVIAGTTDSNAAFLASGASQIGDGVTSLGTTLAIKLLSDKPVTDLPRGVYSHRIGSMWLPGGASNSGGGVLLDHFTSDQLSQLESELNPTLPTGLDYYPLCRPGERFPINDSSLPSRMTPRPPSDAMFLQAILEGISNIEKIGYDAIAELGAPAVKQVFTAGGGANNQAWSKIREQKLGVPVLTAGSTDAAYGTARIAAGL